MHAGGHRFDSDILHEQTIKFAKRKYMFIEYEKTSPLALIC